jgi:hypothetical protein
MISKLNGYPIKITEEKMRSLNVLVCETGYVYHLAPGEKPLCNRPLDTRKIPNPLFTDEPASYRCRGEPNFCPGCLAELCRGDDLKNYQRRGL